jgi:tetratricopeptide (TPR) repeat protein
LSLARYLIPSFRDSSAISTFYFAWCCRSVTAAWLRVIDFYYNVIYSKVLKLRLTRASASVSMSTMAKVRKASGGSSHHSKSSGHGSSKAMKKKSLGTPPPPQRGGVELVDPRVQAQLKTYDEALALFHQQKFARAKQELEEVLKGPSKELADRARMHLKIAEQRMKPSQEQNPRSAEDHYQRGVAMMNIGRWDDARESLDKARKAAPKADHIHYALAALDCLTGEADSALENLKIAIQLRPENRYHARNDEDFAFLQEDPRFTELLYPEKDGLAS